MIIFLNIPFTTTRLRAGLTAALGADRCQFAKGEAHAKTLSMRAPKSDGHILVATMPLEAAVALADGGLITTFVGRPEPRLTAAWRAAIADPKHPDHADAHTFRIVEALAEARPFAARQNNLATKLLAPGGAPDGGAAVKALAAANTLVGWAAHPFAYADALERALKLPSGTLERGLFNAPLPTNADGPFGTLARTQNAADIALLKGLATASGGAPVFRP